MAVQLQWWPTLGRLCSDMQCGHRYLEAFVENCVKKSRPAAPRLNGTHHGQCTLAHTDSQTHGSASVPPSVTWTNREV